MSLSKIIKPLAYIFLFTLFSLLFTLIFPSPVLAQCNINNCLYPEHGQTGTCQVGTVLQCDDGKKECVGSSWVDTEADLNDLCSVSYSTGTVDQKIINALKSKELNVEKWTIGSEAVGGEEAGMFGLLTRAVFFSTAGTNESLASGGGGAIGSVAGLIGSMYENPPASTKEYLADLGKNLGIVKPAYAQGTGWQALDPILPIWKAFRNIAYMGFVIIFIVIGFMIMFRAKINPQTVISIQSALPKIIITLLLVTFSYAIAGLMIDLIYILIYLLVGVFQLGGLINSSSDVVNKLLSGNPITFIYPKGSEDLFTSGPADAIQEIVSAVFGGGAYSRGGGEDPLSQTVGVLAKTILAVAVLFKVFSLFFSLLMSYLGIIMSVIFAPFTILFNALPGSTSFMGWLKGLFANVIVFPIVAGMFLIAAVLIGPKTSFFTGDEVNPWGVSDQVGFYSGRGEQEAVWVPPMLIGEVHDEEAGPVSVNAFQGLIALGMIMMMPTVVGKVKKMLKVEPSGFGGAIVGGLLAGPSAVGGFAQQAYGMYSQRMSIKAAQSRIATIRKDEKKDDTLVPKEGRS